MATIYIDDQAYQVEEGKNVLEAALNAGLDLPYFCWHPAMGSVGACRQCALVQFRDKQDTQGRIVMGCMTMVTDGARFSMQGDGASQFRENIVESLMLNHPHDCPVCAEGGECHLQDMTVMVGHRDRRYRGKKNTHRNQDLGPLLNHEMNRCIACYRCTRFYQDYAGGNDLAAHGAHDHVYFGRHQDGTLESEFAGNLVEVCPTGVFTDKPLVNDYTRKWDLQSAPSICGGCAVGCNTMPGERYGKLKRVHNRYNSQVNNYFLCDRGRYGHSYVNDQARPSYPGQRNQDGTFDAIDEEDALSTLCEWLKSGNVVGIGSPRASLESNFLLKELVGDDHFVTGVADAEAQLISEVLDTLRHGSVKTPSLQDVEAADAVLILGEDVTNTAPRLALSLRQSVRNKAKASAAQLQIPEWQDEAVRTLAQDQLSPLYIASINHTRLDDVAAARMNDDPIGIARFGFAVAAMLDTTLPPVNGLSAENQALAASIAADLSSAQRPLIVSGTGCNSADVLRAASAIAHALRQYENGERAMLSYCLPEANSLGVAMLWNDQNLSFEALNKRNHIDTLVVLENDLYRRAAKSSIDQLLGRAKRVVVIDALPNATMEQAVLVLPAATLIEAEGTLVSSEGRAQRHYPVFLAEDQRAPAWQWLTRLGQARNITRFKGFKYFDDVVAYCAASHPLLAEIIKAAPGAEFRNRGVKIPRQPHRYSGRTAMQANISLHEPKQPEDTGTPFSFSMEGDNSLQPGALLPFVWSPGWNSNQSLHKFQNEINGELAGGNAGHRLFTARKASNNGRDHQVPDETPPENGSFELVPIYRIFGSEELSSRCTAITELICTPFLEINPRDATRIGVRQGDTISTDLDATSITLRIVIDPKIKAGMAAISAGLPGMPYISPGQRVRFSALKIRSDDV